MQISWVGRSTHLHRLRHWKTFESSHLIHDGVIWGDLWNCRQEEQVGGGQHPEPATWFFMLFYYGLWRYFTPFDIWLLAPGNIGPHLNWAVKRVCLTSGCCLLSWWPRWPGPPGWWPGCWSGWPWWGRTWRRGLKRMAPACLLLPTTLCFKVCIESSFHQISHHLLLSKCFF